VVMKEMKVSQLMAKLQLFMEKYGDLPVIGRGFDEGGYDPIAMSSDPITVRRCTCGGHRASQRSHHGMYDTDEKGPVIVACFVDANCYEEES